MSTITYRQDRPAARIAIVLTTVAAISAVLFYTFGLNALIGAIESSREMAGGRYVVAAVVTVIFLPPAFVLVRLASPKQEVVFGDTALTIKAKREQTSITYADIGSMVRHEYTARRLELYDRAGQLLYCFRTATDRPALSSLVRLLTEQIAFDTGPEGRAVRYVRR